MPPTIVHFSTDTLPRVVENRTATPTLDLLLPFRVDASEGGLHVASWQLDVQVDGRSWTDRTRTRRLPSGLAGALRDRMRRHGRFTFDHLPYYAALDDAAIDAGRAVYVEGRVPGVPAGATVTYTLTATVDGAGPVSSRPYTTRALSSRFERAQIRRIYVPTPGRADQGWVLYHEREDRYDRFRVDVVELSEGGGITPEHVPLRVQFGQKTVLELGGDEPDVLPLIDVAADAVTFAVPHDGGPLPSVSVQYREAGDTVHLDHPGDPAVGETRLMFVNFAIQGLNDLFATADDDYTPPRTYTQVTMRDEAASYSSRPGARERHTGDGYAFTLEAHRRYGIPQLWAMNGGLLGLLAHDRPDDLADMRADVDAGLLVPVVAGYGAHRLPYYSTATNTDAMVFGDEAMRNILGRTSTVYYPDSRITTAAPQVRDALHAAGVQYLVVDAGAGEGPGTDTDTTVVVDAKPELGTTTGTGPSALYASWQNLWFDQYTGTKVLFIDRDTKDKLLNSDDWQADRGKVHYELRRKFIELAAQPTLRAGNLVVYSDDADKASGNGWFDGFYNNDELPYNHRYQAALSWLAAHPWVRVVTTTDLDDEEPVGRLCLERASDPKMPDWNLGIRRDPGEPSFRLAFDTWYYAWAHTRAAWLGESLAAVSTRAETAIAKRREGPARDDELVLLARLYLTLCLHESQWSKRPRFDDVPDVGAPGRTDVEDFVVAESLQLRNAHVYLAASFWSQWAAAVAQGVEQPGAHRDDGPVVAGVEAFERKRFTEEGTPAWSRAGSEGLQWDHDPLPNVVLYNEDVLVVIDRNGGRITHLFGMVDGRPISVSGTHKAYQFLDMDWASDGGTECDGSVLQNTVATPNHAYVAGDIDASQGTIGASPAGDPEFDWYYPDNFNAYDVTDPAGLPEVTLTYGPATTDGPAPATIADLERELADDREQKVAGGRGIVRHDVDEFGAFAKTIRLDGRTVHVEYRGTRPGHRVANEFCVDLLRSALHGQRQTHAVAADGRSGTVTNEGGLEVRVVLDAGCAFTEAACAPLDPPTVESLRVHRVTTDNLEIVAPDGGDFSYRIVLF